MHKRIKFLVSDNFNLTEKTIEYFEKTGYKQLYNDEERLIFKRGSIALNFWTSNPFKWKSIVEIVIIGQEILVDFKINATGHIPTQKDERRWDRYIANYKHFLTDKNFDLKTENENLKENSLTDYIGWSGVIGFITGFSGRFISDWTGLNWIVIIVGVYSIYLLLTKVINDKKIIKTPYNKGCSQCGQILNFGTASPVWGDFIVR